jgi:hypothetical protein
MSIIQAISIMIKLLAIANLSSVEAAMTIVGLVEEMLDILIKQLKAPKDLLVVNITQVKNILVELKISMDLL